MQRAVATTVGITPNREAGPAEVARPTEARSGCLHGNLPRDMRSWQVPGAENSSVCGLPSGLLRTGTLVHVSGIRQQEWTLEKITLSCCMKVVHESPAKGSLPDGRATAGVS